MLHEVIIAPRDAAKTDVSLSQMRLSYHNNVFWTKMMDFKCSFEY